MARTEYTTKANVSRLAKLEDAAQAIGASVEALATELDRERRAFRGPREAQDFGYSVPLVNGPRATATGLAPTPLARQRMAELTKAIGLTADAWVTANGNTVRAYRSREHASHTELANRVDRANAAEGKAELALDKAEATGLEATISAAKARATRAANAAWAARLAFTEAAEAAGASQWERFTETVLVAEADAEAMDVEGMARNVRDHTGTRKDVMPLRYRDALRPDADREVKDPVGESVVGCMVDLHAQHAVAAEWLEAIAEFAREVVAASDDAIQAEAAAFEAAEDDVYAALEAAEARREARAEAQRARRAGKAMERLSNSLSRK